MEKLDVANRIKDLRNQKGLSQNALANLAGVSPTYIYQLERGEKSPTVEYLYYICSALGITLEEFFREESTPKQKDCVGNLSPTQLNLLNQFLNSL